MPFISVPAGSSPLPGDDNLNVSMGNYFNSSSSGKERRSHAAAWCIESHACALCYHSGFREHPHASQNCTHSFHSRGHAHPSARVVERCWRGYQHPCSLLDAWERGSGGESQCSLWDQTVRVWEKKNSAARLLCPRWCSEQKSKVELRGESLPC